MHEMGDAANTLLILGTRGVPANHGGFETFAEQLAVFLVSRGWDVSVYCQRDVATVNQRVDTQYWNGVRQIVVETSVTGPLGTLDFDWACIRDAVKRPGLCLVLGYNSAVFLPYLRLHGRKVFTNMDGIEWRRPKWSRLVRSWFGLNEWIAAWSSHRLVADHPAIANHLATRGVMSKTVIIPYGGVPVEEASDEPLAPLGLESGRYLISIARIEPENNILTIVEAFSRRKRGMKLVVLGDFAAGNKYHQLVRQAASDEVVFPGSIYEPALTSALRFHARAYMHGHTVGGTNPSLVEALWAGNAIVAHDNQYNRWTAGDAGVYFADATRCEDAIQLVIEDDIVVAACAKAARERARSAFRWSDVLHAYERECLKLLDDPPGEMAPGAVVQAETMRWS